MFKLLLTGITGVAGYIFYKKFYCYTNIVQNETNKNKYSSNILDLFKLFDNPTKTLIDGNDTNIINNVKTLLTNLDERNIDFELYKITDPSLNILGDSIYQIINNDDNSKRYLIFRKYLELEPNLNYKYTKSELKLGPILLKKYECSDNNNIYSDTLCVSVKM